VGSEFSLKDSTKEGRRWVSLDQRKCLPQAR